MAITRRQFVTRLGALAAALVQLNPQATLERGYSIVRDLNGQVIRSSKEIATGDALEVRFSVGWAHAKVSETD